MTATAVSRLSSERIKVRRMDFEFGPDIPEHWAHDNPVLTALMAGLSASFPPGERYFIESVRHYAERVTDPEMKERIRRFIGQEANHTKEHIAFNEFLDRRGLPILKMQAVITQALKALKKRNSPASNLARTAALEHMTAFLASALLEHPDMLENAHPEVAAFWAWHAIEEIEHRSVAFDVYKEFVDNELLRRGTMASTTVVFVFLSGLRTALLLKRNGHLLDLTAWKGCYDLMFGEPGVLRKALPLYRAYYRRDFHPDQHDNHATVERAKSTYLGAKA
jgi:predicted metal-dependent hydrolase